MAQASPGFLATSGDNQSSAFLSAWHPLWVIIGRAASTVRNEAIRNCRPLSQTKKSRLHRRSHGWAAPQQTYTQNVSYDLVEASERQRLPRAAGTW